MSDKFSPFDHYRTYLSRLHNLNRCSPRIKNKPKLFDEYNTRVSTILSLLINNVSMDVTNLIISYDGTYRFCMKTYCNYMLMAYDPYSRCDMHLHKCIVEDCYQSIKKGGKYCSKYHKCMNKKCDNFRDAFFYCSQHYT